MDFLKSKTQIFRPKTIISLNPLFYKEKEFLKEDDYKNQIINNYNYLNLKNTQSISTSIDDIKNNEIKDFCSMNNLMPINILKNTILIKEINCLNKLSVNLFQKQINLKSNNENEKIFENKLILKIGKDKNSLNNNKNIIENNIEVKNVINPKNVNNKNFNDNKTNKSIHSVIRAKKNEESKIFQEDTIKNKNNILIKKELLSSFPPKISLLYNNKYLLESDTKNNFLNDNSYKKLSRSVVPNIFYNHIMIKNKKAKFENQKFNSISTTNRIKGKLLTIIYFIPI